MTTVLQGPQLARLLGRWQGGRNVPDYAALAATVRGLVSDGRDRVIHERVVEDSGQIVDRAEANRRPAIARRHGVSGAILRSADVAAVSHVLDGEVRPLAHAHTPRARFMNRV